MTEEPKEAEFESAMKKLSAIVEKLEKGDLTLDSALKLYEEGVKLSQLSQRRLEEAQKKIELLTRNSDKGFETTELDEETLKPKAKKTKGK